MLGTMNLNAIDIDGKRTDRPIRIARVEARAYSAPAHVPVRSSYVTMSARSAVYVRIEDTDGAVGWGEIWCNFPECGSVHRVRLVETLAASVVVEYQFYHPRELYNHMVEVLTPFMVQSGEFGPLAQVISGIDMAAWDLAARKMELPLARYINPDAAETVKTYASALDVDNVSDVANEMVGCGHNAFKLKIGFADGRDERNLRSIRDAAGPQARVFVDANQRWTVDEAIEAIAAIAPFGINFVEEPLSVNAPDEAWQTLAKKTDTPLATGENIMSNETFERYIAAGAIRHLQPDIAKWGGISGVLVHARNALKAGIAVSPHFLGGGIGLLASAHVLAALGGDGFQEWDANPNPLREKIVAMPEVRAGAMILPMAPGFGAEPQWESIAEYRIDS